MGPFMNLELLKRVESGCAKLVPMLYNFFSPNIFKRYMTIHMVRKSRLNRPLICGNAFHHQDDHQMNACILRDAHTI
jgi:hypothetical protein